MKMKAEILLLLLAATFFEVYGEFVRDLNTGEYNENRRNNNYILLRNRLPKTKNPTEERRSQSVESSDLCGRWDDWCSQSSANPVLQCCPGYACKCSVWNSNCKCRTKIFTGKWKWQDSMSCQSNKWLQAIHDVLTVSQWLITMFCQSEISYDVLSISVYTGQWNESPPISSTGFSVLSIDEDNSHAN